MARERNKPTQSWMERAKIEMDHEEELTIERAYELGKIRGKKETIEKACKWFINWAKATEWYTQEESLEMLRRAMEE